MPLSIALIGRPNVGKSTLFNRLVGRRLAIVDDTPGVTRDWRAERGSLAGMPLIVIDTAGLEEAFDDRLEARMRQMTETAVTKADVLIFIIDARAGVTPLDEHFARWVRKQKKTVIIVANKCEGRAGMAGLAEAHALGLGDVIPLSAAHGEGLGELYDALLPHAPADLYEDDEDENFDPDEAEDAEDGVLVPKLHPERPIQVAIVGRPNAGKSTLMNALLGEERVLTGPEAGLTRDAISADFAFEGQMFRLVDTAGLRRKARIDDKLEKLSTADTINALKLAEVVILVLDADAVLDKQDLAIADLAEREGRGLVIAVNKWDAAADKTASLNRLNDRLQTSLAQLSGLPTVTISALYGRGLDTLMESVIDTARRWRTRISTSRINRFLRLMHDANPPPMVSGRSNRVRYATQVKARPPTFALWCSHPDEMPDSWTRYFINGLRQQFDLSGVPIRLLLRKGENPYEKSGRRK